ncbi:MAG: homoserine O-succinyltransferase [Porphyromonadaceae bacterium]|nr:homoserine O-succinyltransferase [Porphyromonadaceae bacterium]
MPLNIPSELPAVELLKAENIFVMESQRALSQDIRPLRIIILNLMPLKITTETDLIRLLSNTPLQIEIDFLKISGHVSKNTPVEHMMTFYKDFSEVRDRRYDGMIITGAPVEHLAFEDVSYWEEICQIFDWTQTHVSSTVYICWAAQAGLYHHYGIPKYPLEKKLFGVYRHIVSSAGKMSPLFRGFDDEFYIPHSRYTTIHEEDVICHPELTIMAESEFAGPAVIIARHGREIFLTGHSEYAPDTLANEYHRDVNKGLPIEIPRNYFRNDNPASSPLVRWRAHANLLFSNWLNYYVYQETPYDIEKIR